MKRIVTRKIRTGTGTGCVLVAGRKLRLVPKVVRIPLRPSGAPAIAKDPKSIPAIAIAKRTECSHEVQGSLPAKN